MIYKLDNKGFYYGCKNMQFSIEDPLNLNSSFAFKI